MTIEERQLAHKAVTAEKLAEKIANELQVEKTQDLVKDIKTALSALVLLRGEEVLERKECGRTTKLIDGSRLVGNLDQIKDYLSSLQKEGYYAIYEFHDNVRGSTTIAYKLRKETDEEYYTRLIGAISPYLKKYEPQPEKSLWELMQEMYEWANGFKS